MNTYLKELIVLSDIDKEVSAFEPRIQEINAALLKVENEKSELSQSLERATEEIKETQVKKEQHDLHLSELSNKIKEIGKKSKAIKSEKEQKALSLEEEIAKEQVDFANEEIERLDKLIDTKKEESQTLTQSIQEADEKIKKCQAEVSQELGEIEKQREEVYSKKEKLVSKMNQKTLTFYEKIKKWAKNTAVVPVRKQACYGCFMRINDKTYSAVIASEDITTCPHCGRILYKEETEEESA